MAGAAKNAAALGAAAAEAHGLNAAGIAAATIWRECVDYALGRGAQLETFTGLAGVGDLTATVHGAREPQPPRRRAARRRRRRRTRSRGRIGQASEGLDSVPLIAEAIARAGLEAPGLDGLAALIAGRIDPERVGRRAAARRACPAGRMSAIGRRGATLDR